MPTGSRSVTVAIQPDDGGPRNTSSTIWLDELRRAGVQTRIVDVGRPDILEQVRGCQGFMWRCGHHSWQRQIGRRLLPVLERELDMVVYPNIDTFWHYDDKIAQAYLFQAHDLPCPRTWVFFDEAQARRWAQSAPFPVVYKLASGAGSRNVGIVSNTAEAENLIDCMFWNGVRTLSDRTPLARFLTRSNQQLRHLGKRLLPRQLGGRLEFPHRLRDALAPPDRTAFEVHKHYVLFQEFLAGNAYDTRVTVVGDRAFAFRRFNRPNDFRASGSGNFSTQPSEIDLAFVRLAFRVARELRLQSVAIDGLYRGAEPVVGEISYAYVSSAVQSCPGQWDDSMRWHEGQLWPEQQQAKVMLRLLDEHATQSSSS